jgi:hypothetical protein
MATTLGKETFDLNKGEYSDKLGRIISNHRANSKLIGEPCEFVLRSCRLSDQWMKLAGDPDTEVYLRNVDIAGGRKVKMLSLERTGTKQPVSKSKLIDALYPPKKIATTATPEEKNFNAVKVAMRNGVALQLKAFRDSVTLPTLCIETGFKIRKGMKTDVDHIGMPFSEIAEKFVASKGLKYTDITLVGPPTGKYIKDDQLRGEWVAFHMAHARYALVCSSANRSKGNGDYSTPEELYGSFKAETPDELSLDF